MGNVVTLSLSKPLQNQSCLNSDMNNQSKYNIETRPLQSNGFTQTIPLVFIQWRQMWHITWRPLLGLRALSFRKACVVGLLVHSILHQFFQHKIERVNRPTNKTCFALQSLCIMERATEYDTWCYDSYLWRSCYLMTSECGGQNGTKTCEHVWFIYSHGREMVPGERVVCIGYFKT